MVEYYDMTTNPNEHWTSQPEKRTLVTLLFRVSLCTCSPEYLSFFTILAVYLSNVLGWSLVLVHYLTPDQILYLTICVYNFERVWNNAVWEKEGAGGWCALEGFLYPISENRDPYDVWREIRCSLLLTFIKYQKRKKTKRVSTENVSYII